MATATAGVFPEPKKREHEESRLKLLEAATGREVAELAREKDATFSGIRFTSDGRTLAAVTWRPPHKERKPAPKKLYLFSIADKRPPQTVLLENEPKGHWLVVREPVFSPNGKWVAVVKARQRPRCPRRSPSAHSLDRRGRRRHPRNSNRAAGIPECRLFQPRRQGPGDRRPRPGLVVGSWYLTGDAPMTR